MRIVVTVYIALLALNFEFLTAQQSSSSNDESSDNSEKAENLESAEDKLYQALLLAKSIETAEKAVQDAIDSGLDLERITEIIFSTSIKNPLISDLSIPKTILSESKIDTAELSNEDDTKSTSAAETDRVIIIESENDFTVSNDLNILELIDNVSEIMIGGSSTNGGNGFIPTGDGSQSNTGNTYN